MLFPLLTGPCHHLRSQHLTEEFGHHQDPLYIKRSAQRSTYQVARITYDKATEQKVKVGYFIFHILVCPSPHRLVYLDDAFKQKKKS